MLPERLQESHENREDELQKVNEGALATPRGSRVCPERNLPGRERRIWGRSRSGRRDARSGGAARRLAVLSRAAFSPAGLVKLKIIILMNALNL